VIRQGVMPASRGGKLKTVLQAIALGLYLLPWESVAVLHWTAVVFMTAAVIVTIVTGFDYMGRAVRLRAAAKRPLP
jgi:CDP-diacylglycerol--glycerol-3-phosphate 3-phosphatidyltransferase